MQTFSPADPEKQATRLTGQAWPDIVCVSRTSEARGLPLKIIKFNQLHQVTPTKLEKNQI